MSACVNRFVSCDEVPYFGNQFMQMTNALVGNHPKKNAHSIFKIPE